MTGAVVVGTGFGCYTHVRALRAAGFDVLAVVGRDPAKTAERAALFEVPVALTSLDEALTLAGVDAVTIATPPHTHAPLARQAIAAGRHVLCEKPFAADTEEAQDVLDAAESAGVVHVLGTEFRWDPGQAGLARAVAAGLVGEPRLATWLMHVPVLADPGATVPAWWADAGAGGGWLWAHGSQLIDQIRVTLGEFEGVERLPGPRGRPACDERGRRLRGALQDAQRRRGGDAVDGGRSGRPGRDPGDRVHRGGVDRGCRAHGQGGGRQGSSHPAGRRGPANGRAAAAARRCGDHHLREDDHLRGRVRALRTPRRRLS